MKCYRLAVEEEFRILKPQDEDGLDLFLDEDKFRHLEVRDGDHFLVQFQYELCHYQNMKNLNPGMSAEDIKLLRFIKKGESRCVLGSIVRYCKYNIKIWK